MIHGSLRAAFLAAFLFTGAASGAGPHARQIAPAGDAAPAQPVAPGSLQRTLEDEQRFSAPGRIAWSTYWKLCWQSVADARFYEIRLVTSEGAPRRPTRLTDTCYRIEAAAGENATEDGMPRRELMLAMQAAQAALQVRAVLRDGRATAWTAEQAIGATGLPRH